MEKLLQGKEQLTYLEVTKLLKTATDIQAFLSKEEFIEKTRQQIEKDLAGLFPFRPTIKQNILLSFQDEMALLIQKMSTTELQQFLYRVDLKEEISRHYLNNTIHLNQLTFSIVERESQKVFLRTQFKS